MIATAQIHELKVTPEEAGSRLDKFLPASTYRKPG